MSNSINLDEQTYLELIRRILSTGCRKPTRTGVDTLSLTGTQLRFNLTHDDDMILPLLTTKTTSFKLILTELLWFLKAGHNAKDLAAQGNHIWDANSSREYLDQLGFKDRSVGELGAIYGVSWRHWNGSWQDEFKTKPGIDQIANLITGLKIDPYGRRHIVSAWNPEQIHEAALPACHNMFQMVVRPNINHPHWLDCIINMRSSDMPLGVPFNIASYSLLTHIVAKLVNLKAGELIINMGDCHIYCNQIIGCNVQLERVPRAFPTIKFKREFESIDTLCVDDFELVGYNPHPAIKFPFAT